ncbi:hypothetical protein OIU84_003228 [Salix udensis]|uniref:Uncharacterized protein n=1 Tax=Salix udensis TaxID=889485 RepID=A0AAD6P5J3_9ROSI|nr:hypothetical protein OIU84_003228 [Salix udensis]
MPQAKNNLRRLRLAAAGGVRGAKHTLSFLYISIALLFQVSALITSFIAGINGGFSVWPLFLQGKSPELVIRFPLGYQSVQQKKLEGHALIKNTIAMCMFLLVVFFFFRFQLYELHRRNQWRILGLASLLARKVSRTCDSIPTWLPVCAAEKLEGHALIKNTIAIC